MKSFREQFIECKNNKTVEMFDAKESERIYLRQNIQGIEYYESVKILFCNKYMKRCSSRVCLKERINTE